MVTTEKQALLEKINNALDEIRPHLKVDGGDVEIVELTDDMVLKVKWLGNCQICQMSTMTMKAGIEQTVKQKIPSITAVEAVNGIGIDA